ncbi:MAG: hypothetical protein IKW01_06235, partial [Firmicutes bacterium]|nr:hypothetical protein [Bacillota bacterium]
FGAIYDNLIAGTESENKVYVSVIPDKGYYMAEGSGRPVIGYDDMFTQVKDQMYYAQFIDITEALDLDDYYKTDLHWRQENILPVAQALGQAMGLEYAGKADRLEDMQAMTDFHGVYYGQSALPLPSEPMYFLTNDVIREATTFNFETNKSGEVYDTEALLGKDPYDVYLSGPTPLVTIDNPAAETDRELVIFRDSFGSSLAPLLIEDYAKITLVDIRYIQSGFLGQYLEFDGQDVLFIYGTTILNDSGLLK